MIKSALVGNYLSAAAASILGSVLGLRGALLPLLAPYEIPADLEPVLGEQVLAHLGEDEVAQLRREARRIALEAGHDRARVELPAVDEDRRPSGAIAVVDAVMIGPDGSFPHQCTFVELDVVAQLELRQRPGRILPGEQVEIVVLEPAAPE